MRRLVTGLDASGAAVIAAQDEVPPLAGLPGSANETRLCWAGAVAPGADPLAPVVADGATPIPGAGQARFVLVTFRPQSETPLHRTSTVDLVAVIEGAVWLVMENGEERELKAGDVAVQNATLHAWHNRSSQPCTIAATMLALA